MAVAPDLSTGAGRSGPGHRRCLRMIRSTPSRMTPAAMAANTQVADAAPSTPLAARLGSVVVPAVGVAVVAWVDAASVGTAVGVEAVGDQVSPTRVGLEVAGAAVGTAVGIEVSGDPVGGDVVGEADAVGETVGAADGVADGGDVVGEVVGRDVAGEADGETVGALDGAAVGGRVGGRVGGGGVGSDWHMQRLPG